MLHDGVDVHLVMVQMPALNTPQFNWARNKMSRRPQPVPPIFQPEIAADAIVYAAHSRRREVWVGGSSVQVIVANKLFPGLLDRYLAKKGYTGQLTDEPADPGQPDNLFDPVPATPIPMDASTAEPPDTVCSCGRPSIVVRLWLAHWRLPRSPPR